MVAQFSRDTRVAHKVGAYMRLGVNKDRDSMDRYIILRIEVFHSSRLGKKRKQANMNFVQMMSDIFSEGRIREFWSVGLERKYMGVEPKNIQ